MANYNMKVRAGFTVITGGPNANSPGAVVNAAGSTVVLSDLQVLGHLHKLDSTDAGSVAKLAALLGAIWKPHEEIT